MHRKQQTFTCTTSDTSCTARLDGTSVNFCFCITITAHGHNQNITSHPRCQSGRTEGEVSPTCILIIPLLLLSHSSLPIFLSDVVSSDIEEQPVSQWETSVSESNLELHLVWLSFVWLGNQSWRPEIANRIHSTGTGLPLPITSKHKTTHCISQDIKTSHIKNIITSHHSLFSLSSLALLMLILKTDASINLSKCHTM